MLLFFSEFAGAGWFSLIRAEASNLTRGFSAAAMPRQAASSWDCMCSGATSRRSRIAAAGQRGDGWGWMARDFQWYPLVITNKKLLNMAIEIVDLSIKNGDFPWLCGSLTEGKPNAMDHPQESVVKFIPKWLVD